MAEEKDLAGLRGWLIIVGLGLIISPLRVIVQLFPIYAKIFSDGTWGILTTPGSNAYNPLWAPILLGEVAVNLGLILTSIFVAFLYFTKKRIFPKWYSGFLVFTLAFMLLDAIALTFVLPGQPIFDSETSVEFGRTFIVTLIWVPYMFVSKRVKATFIN